MKRLLAAVGTVVLTVSAPCLAAIQCPTTHNGSRLHSFSVFEGNPDENADLAPDSSRRVRDGGYVNIYKLEPNTRLVAICYYADGDKLQMVISPGTKVCRSAGTPRTLKAGCE